MKRCIAKSAMEFIAASLCKHKAMMSPASSGDRLLILVIGHVLSLIGQRMSPPSTTTRHVCDQQFMLSPCFVKWLKWKQKKWYYQYCSPQNWNPQHSAGRWTKCGHTSLIDTPAINPLLSSPGQPRNFHQQLAEKNEKWEQQTTLVVRNKISTYWNHHCFCKEKYDFYIGA